MRLKLQREVVKWPLPRWAAIVLALATASCAPHPHPPVQAVAGWNGNESPAYRSGHGDGSRDKREGRPYASGTRQGKPANLEPYAQGYAAGYRSPHDNPWSRPRARELGETHGREDRQAGRPKNPDRQSGVVPQAMRNDFRQGYEAAWN